MTGSDGIEGGIAPAADGRSRRWAEHRARRRDEVVDAALVVLGRDGHDFAMDQVAQEAGVTKPVIYRHFADRAALLDAMAERATDRLMERVMPVIYDESSIRPRIRGAVNAVMCFLDDSPNINLLFRRRLPGQTGDVVDLGRDFVSVALLGLLRGYVEGLGFDEEELVQVWSQVLVGSVQTTAEWWLGSRTMTRDAVTQHLTTLLWAQIDGLARQNGLELDPDRPVTARIEPK